MNEISRETLLNMIQAKSAQYLKGQGYSYRAGLNVRIHQIKGMMELVAQLPEHPPVLLDILQEHLQWLEKKQKNWPV